MVFSLAGRLGGRKEVLQAPIVETMGYLLLLREENRTLAKKEEIDRWITYLSLVNSHPEVDSKARENFMKMIEPKTENNPVHNPVPKYETDIDLLKRLKAQQEGG